MSSPELQALVARLVALHGDGGAAPAAADWIAILQAQRDRPLTLLNLLKLKAEVQTADGVRSGVSEYRRYSAKVAAPFARVGGKLVFVGNVAHAFPQHAAAGWDVVVLTRYPGPRALVDFWLDPEFIEAHKHRVDAIEKHQVLLLESAPEL